MKKLLLSTINEYSKRFTDGRVELILKDKTVHNGPDGDYIEFSYNEMMEFRRKFHPNTTIVEKICCGNGVKKIMAPRKQSNNIQPTPPIIVDKDWPLLLRPMKLLSKSGDIGLGDIVTHLIGEENSETFKKWFKEVFKHDCGCNARKEYLNTKYPL